MNGKYYAELMVNKIRYHSKSFKDIEDAAEARINLEALYV